MRNPTALCAVVSLLLVACAEQRESTTERGDHIWRAQTDAMDKARRIEGVVHDAASRRRERLEQSQ